MTDTTETYRRAMIASGMAEADLNRLLASDQRWSTDDMLRDFIVIGFLAPYVMVRRRSDGKEGTLEFTHSPRVYFDWQEA